MIRPLLAGVVVDDTQRPFVRPGTHLSITHNVESGLRIGWALTAEAGPSFDDAGIAIQY